MIHRTYKAMFNFSVHDKLLCAYDKGILFRFCSFVELIVVVLFEECAAYFLIY